MTRGLVFGPLFTLGIAYLYALSVIHLSLGGWFNPVHWLINCLCVMFVVISVGRLSRCRNALGMRLFGWLIGALALYLNWFVFFWLVEILPPQAEAGFFDTISQPHLVLGAFTALLDGDLPYGNGFTEIVWAFEGLFIVGSGGLAGSVALDEEVYCERCSEWADALEPSLLFEIPRIESELEAACRGNLSEILAWPVATEDTFPRVRVNIQRCPSCTATATLDLDKITSTPPESGEGEPAVESEDISPLFALSRTQLEAFEARIQAQREGRDAILDDAVDAYAQGDDEAPQ